MAFAAPGLRPTVALRCLSALSSQACSSQAWHFRAEVAVLLDALKYKDTRSFQEIKHVAALRTGVLPGCQIAISTFSACRGSGKHEAR